VLDGVSVLDNFGILQQNGMETIKFLTYPGITSYKITVRIKARKNQLDQK
jgi:hypothetical protein